MEHLLFGLLNVVLEWSPRVFAFLMEKFPRSGAAGITFVVCGHDRPTECKILVDITNNLAGQSVRLARAHFAFEKNSPLNPDPQWSRKDKTGLFHLCFFSRSTQMHDWRDVYLRFGEQTNVWIGIDPQHPPYEIEKVHGGKRFGRLYFQMTRWTDSGRPKARWVRVKL